MPMLGSWLAPIAAFVSALGGLLAQFPPNTIAHKVGLGILGAGAAGAALSPGLQKKSP